MMKARNELEKKVLEMVKNGEKLHGFAKEVLVEMTLREMEEKEEKNKKTLDKTPKA